MVDESRQPGRPGATSNPIGTRARNRTIVMNSSKATALISGDGTHESQPEGSGERGGVSPERTVREGRKFPEQIDPPLSKSQDDSYKALEEILEIASQGTTVSPPLSREKATEGIHGEESGTSESATSDLDFDSSWFTAKKSSSKSSLPSGEMTYVDRSQVTRETDSSKPVLDSENPPGAISKKEGGELLRSQGYEDTVEQVPVLRERTPRDTGDVSKSFPLHPTERVAFERVPEIRAGQFIEGEEVYWQSETPLFGFLVSYDHNPNGTFVALRTGRLIVSSRREESGSCLVLRDDSVSPMHAIMRDSSDGGLQVIDQLSEAGTRIRRSGCAEDLHLSGERGEAYHGDRIFFGERSFEVVLLSRAEK